MSASSCWKSSRRSSQLCFWAMLFAWKIFVPSSCCVFPVFMMSIVSRNILSFWLCSSCRSDLASFP